MRSLTTTFVFLLAITSVDAQQPLVQTHDVVPSTMRRTGEVGLGDIDGDGNLDIIFGNGEDSSGEDDLVYLNLRGTGIMSPGPALPQGPATPTVTSAVVLADFDGDGDLDLFLGHSGGATLQNFLYLNAGTGVFTDATARLPIISDVTRDAVAGDLDGDGDLDLIVGNKTPTQVLLNVTGDVNPTFVASTVAFPTPFSGWVQDVALGDLDGDGDLDVVFGCDGPGSGPAGPAGQNYAMLNNGAGVFTGNGLPAGLANTLAVALGDIDGDGDLDLATGNDSEQDRLFLNNGTGVFMDVTVPRMPVDSERSSSIAFNDFDGDGDLDLVIGTMRGSGLAGGQNRYYENDGNGFFADLTTSKLRTQQDHTRALAVGDMDGDGDGDVVFANGRTLGEANRLVFNDGNDLIDYASTLPPNSSEYLTSDFALGDIDGDGFLDAFVAHSSLGAGAPSYLWRNGGAGVFEDVSNQLPVMTGETRAGEFGDFDGDGDLDLATTGQFTRIYANDGSGTFTLAYTLYSRGGTDLVVGDFNLDGDPDIAVATYTGHIAEVHLGGPGVSFGSQITISAQSPVAVDAADVDGDNNLDLAFATPHGDMLFLNDGLGGFVDVSNRLSAIYQSGVVRFRDLNGDGDPDIVFGGGSATNHVYVNQGGGFFGGDMTFGTGKIMRDVEFDDFDLDGDTDLLVANNGPNEIFLNDGLANFSLAAGGILPSDSDQTRALAMGDLDGDGDMDVLVGNDSMEDRAYMRGPQIHAPRRGMSVGKTFSLDVVGDPGVYTGYSVSMAFALYPTPVILPTGAFWLAPPVYSVGTGALVNGFGTWAFFVPISTGPIGAPVYFQVVHVGAQTLISNLEAVTIDAR